jgi:hypothetical protein
LTLRGRNQFCWLPARCSGPQEWAVVQGWVLVLALAALVLVLELVVHRQ